MKIGVITLFPEMFAALNYGVIHQAQKRKLIEIQYWNPRDYTEDKYHTVDDRPYGGGPGMLMKAEPLTQAIHAAKNDLPKKSTVIYVSPQGKKFDQKIANALSGQNSIILVAGRYEGIDQRIIDSEIDQELSIGDYVLSGGELAIMVIIDSLVRLIPGVLGDEESAKQDSFINGLLDHPHYTRPEVINEKKVPETLLSGDHEAIARWRLKQALGQTWLKRSDLLEKYPINEIEQKLLQEFIHEYKKT